MFHLASPPSNYSPQADLLSTFTAAPSLRLHYMSVASCVASRLAPGREGRLMSKGQLPRQSLDKRFLKGNFRGIWTEGGGYMQKKHGQLRQSQSS